jgi:hypothetical protein
VFYEVHGEHGADGADVLVVLSRAQCQLGDWDGAEQSARAAAGAMAQLPEGELDRIRVQAAQALGEVLFARGDYAAAP